MNRTFDRYTGVVFLAIAAYFMIESQRITNSSLGSSVGPGLFPFLLGVILTLLSIRLIYETFRYQKQEGKKKNLNYKRFGIIFVSLVLYAYFLEDVGYVIATFLFLLIGFQAMEKGKIWHSVIISGLFSLGIYYVFVVLLNITLPPFPA